MGYGGQNDFSVAQGLDSMMAKTRRNPPVMPDTSVERRLEMFHDDVESDRRGYDLDQDERKALDLREKIRRRELYLAKQDEEKEQEQLPKRLRDGSSPDMHRTYEESLESRHENQNKTYSDRDMPQIKPSRIHSVAETRYQQMLRLAQVSMFNMNDDAPEFKRTHTSTEATPEIRQEPMGRFDAQRVQKKIPATGLMSTTFDPVGDYFPQGEFERALNTWKTDDAGGQPSWGERTLAFGDGDDQFGYEDEIGTNAVGTQPLVGDSDLDQFMESPIGEGTEQALDEQREQEEGHVKNLKMRRKQRPGQMNPNKGSSETDKKMGPDGTVSWYGMGDDPRYQGGNFSGADIPWRYLT
jgi:hypothetical protein